MCFPTYRASLALAAALFAVTPGSSAELSTPSASRGALRKAGGLPEPLAAPEPNGTAPANKPAAPPGAPGTPAPGERAQVQRNIQTGSTGKAPARPAGAAAGGTARGAQ